MNPAFQGSAAAYARALNIKLEVIASDIDKIKKNTDELMRTLQVLSSLSLEEKKLFLEESHKEIKCMNEIDQHLGSMKTIVAKAIVDNKSIQLQLEKISSCRVSVTDYSIEQKRNQEKNGGQLPSIETFEDNYLGTARVQPGHFREYVISDIHTQQPVGRFIEERISAPVNDPDSPDKITMTFTEFPSEDNEEARALSAMVMVTQFVASLKHAPSKQHPVFIRGADKDEMEYIATALIVLGQNMPENLEFDMSAIQIDTAADMQPVNFYNHIELFSSSKLKVQVEYAKKILSDKFAHEEDHLAAEKQLDEAISLVNAMNSAPSPLATSLSDENEEEDDDVSSYLSF